MFGLAGRQPTVVTIGRCNCDHERMRVIRGSVGGLFRWIMLDINWRRFKPATVAGGESNDDESIPSDQGLLARRERLKIHRESGLISECVLLKRAVRLDVYRRDSAQKALIIGNVGNPIPESSS
jgi:hypothetical protein